MKRSLILSALVAAQAAFGQSESLSGNSLTISGDLTAASLKLTYPTLTALSIVNGAYIALDGTAKGVAPVLYLSGSTLSLSAASINNLGQFVSTTASGSNAFQVNNAGARIALNSTNDWFKDDGSGNTVFNAAIGSAAGNFNLGPRGETVTVYGPVFTVGSSQAYSISMNTSAQTTTISGGGTNTSLNLISTGSGTIQANGSLVLTSANTAITNSLEAAAGYNPGTVANAACSAVGTFTLTGSAVADSCHVGYDVSVAGGGWICACAVSAASTVKLYCCNFTGASATPGAGTYHIRTISP